MAKLSSINKNNRRIKLDNVSYRVGKMSYGAYFLEPDQENSEYDDFNKNTIWPIDLTKEERINLLNKLT